MPIYQLQLSVIIGHNLIIVPISTRQDFEKQLHPHFVIDLGRFELMTLRTKQQGSEV